jgi:hypothetical protein
MSGEIPVKSRILRGCGEIPVKKLYNSAIFRGSLAGLRPIADRLFSVAREDPCPTSLPEESASVV